jgi:hypothetical protein
MDYSDNSLGTDLPSLMRLFFRSGHGVATLISKRGTMQNV